MLAQHRDGHRFCEKNEIFRKRWFRSKKRTLDKQLGSLKKMKKTIVF